MTLLLFLMMMAPPPDTASDVRALLTAQSDAWNRGDLSGFLAPYWHSDELTFFSGGTVTSGFTKIEQRYQKNYGTSKETMGHLDFENLVVTPLGPEAAAARGRFHLKMKDGSEPTGIFTLLLRKSSSGWMIIHDHTSVGN